MEFEDEASLREALGFDGAVSMELQLKFTQAFVTIPPILMKMRLFSGKPNLL